MPRARKLCDFWLGNAVIASFCAAGLGAASMTKELTYCATAAILKAKAAAVLGFRLPINEIT
jgi:hypothetical protein